MVIVVKGQDGELKEKIIFDDFRKRCGSRHVDSSQRQYLSDSGPFCIKVEQFKLVLRSGESEKYMLVLIREGITLKFSKDEEELYSTQKDLTYVGDIIKQSFARKNRRYFFCPKIYETIGEGVFPLEKADNNIYKIIQPRK